jgi:hypothetical protein
LSNIVDGREVNTVNEKFNVTEYFKLINWNKLKRERNKIFNVDIDKPFTQLDDISDTYDREELLKVNSFVYNTSHEMTTIGNVKYYVILEKIIDNNKNLILFTKSSYHEIRR